jgi:hypothetical protein
MLNGSQTPLFGAYLVSVNQGGLFAGERQIGTYEVLDRLHSGPTRVRGISTDGTIEVIGATLIEVAQAIWLIEQGKGG